MDTTRRYPRTIQEAFPRSVERACAVERVSRRARFPWRAACAALAVLWLLFAVTHS